MLDLTTLHWHVLQLEEKKSKRNAEVCQPSNVKHFVEHVLSFT